MRICYKEKKLHELPIESMSITVENLATLIRKGRRLPVLSNYWSDAQARLAPGKPQASFNFLAFQEGDTFITTPKGAFYLPNAIVFCDRQDAEYPSLFYVLAQIDELLELRVVQGGPQVKWNDVPRLHRPIYDGHITEKVSVSIRRAVEYLAVTPVYPIRLLIGLTWCFSATPYRSQFGFKKKLLAHHQKRSDGKPPPDLTLPVLRSPTVVVRCASVDDSQDAAHQVTFTLRADDQAGFTGLELLFKIHNAVCDPLKDRHAQCFDGLVLFRETHWPDPDTPMYSLTLRR